MRRLLASILLAFVCVACTVTESRDVPERAGSEKILQHADDNFQTRQYLASLEGYKLAAAAAATEKNNANLVIALSQAAHLHVLMEKAESGRDWLQRAQEKARPSEPAAWASYLLARGVYERHDQLTAAALETFTSMYHFSMEHELWAKALQAGHMATLITSGEARLVWGRRALDAAEAAKEPSWVAHQWGALGWLLEEDGRAEGALRAFEAARSIVKVQGSFSERVKADWAVGHALRKAGRAEEAAQLMASVLSRAEERYMLSRTEADAEWLGHAQQEMGELAAEGGKAARAVAWLRQAKKHFVEAGIADAAPDALAELDRRIHQLDASARTQH